MNKQKHVMAKYELLSQIRPDSRLYNQEHAMAKHSNLVFSFVMSPKFPFRRAYCMNKQEHTMVQNKLIPQIIPEIRMYL